MPFCVELQYPDEKTYSVTNLRVSDTCHYRRGYTIQNDK
jgi:hypothetical protein